MDRILHRAIQLQGQWPMEIHQYWTVPRQAPDPSQRSGGCSKSIEEREVSWSWQHPSRTGPSRWRSNHCSHDNLWQEAAHRKMAKPVDPVLGHHTSQERQPAAETEIPNNKPHQPQKQCWRSYQTDWSSKCRRSLLKNKQASEKEGTPQSRFSTWESFTISISSSSKTPWLKKGLACNH